jgi:succinyl-diaminopimelate desuccinylase
MEQAKRQQAVFVAKLKEFLAIDSVEDMSTAGEGKPFGQGVAEALEYMLALGEQDGFRTRNLEGYAGYIEFGQGEEVAVLVHVDVVPAGEGWTTPPFSPDIRDGKIFARGAIDDKGPALAAYFAFRMVRDSGLPLSKRVRFIIGTDEESGWLCMKRYAELEPIPEIGFSPDASFPIIHAEKGQINPLLRLDERAAGAKCDPAPARWLLRSFQAGERGNMVPDRAEAAIVLAAEAGDDSLVEGLVSDYQEFLARQGVSGRAERQDGRGLVLRLDGQAAHGMEPCEGRNAGLILARFLAGQPFGGDDRRFLELLSAVLYEDYFGAKLGIACEDEATGKLTVNAGILTYKQDEGASVHLNIRYPATVNADECVQRLRQAVASLGWKIDRLRTSSGHYVPKDHPCVLTLQKVYEEQTGLPATLLSTGGATYAKTLKAGVAFGPVFPGKEATAHMKDEYAEINDLIAAMAIYAQAIYELAK